MFAGNLISILYNSIKMMHSAHPSKYLLWMHRQELIDITIDYIVYRSLTTYRLWSPMLRFVFDNIKLYNVRERRVNSTEASPIGCVQNVNCNLWTFWGYHVQTGVSVLYDDLLWPLCIYYTLWILHIKQEISSSSATTSGKMIL